MEEKKWNAGSIGLTFAGSFLGAGYVSGQELWQFSARSAAGDCSACLRRWRCWRCLGWR
ncbi:MAG: hypothetical protein ACLRX4_06205 [Oscillospiraceae bacterium]